MLPYAQKAENRLSPHTLEISPLQIGNSQAIDLSEYKIFPSQKLVEAISDYGVYAFRYKSMPDSEIIIHSGIALKAFLGQGTLVPYDIFELKSNEIVININPNALYTKNIPEDGIFVLLSGIQALQEQTLIQELTRLSPIEI